MAFAVSGSFSILLFLSFLSLRCFSLSTVSVSEASDQTLVCALTLRSSLQCSSFPRGSIRLPMSDDIRNLTFSGVVSGNGFVCALWSRLDSNTSLILCWRFSVNGTDLSFKRIYQGPELEELQAGNSRICGLVKESRRLICWQPQSPPPGTFQNFSKIAVGENFLCGLSPPPGRVTCEGNGLSHAPPGGNNYTGIAAGFRQACAITLDSELECWGETNGVTTPCGQFSALALGNNCGCALRTSNGTVVCWGSNNFSLPQTLENTYFSSIEAKGRIFCGVTTGNYTLYCWGNKNFESGIFIPFQEAVLPGPCRRECPCGPMLGSSSLCGGLMICRICSSNEIPRTTPGSPEPFPGQSSRNKTWNKRNIALLVVGCFGTFSVLFVIGFFVFKYCRNRCGCRVHNSGRLDETRGTREEPKLEKRLSHLASLGNTCQLEEFSLDELARATNGFSTQCKIGIGSYGSVYHGVLSDSRHVAIKRAEVTNPSSYGISKHRRDDRDKDTAFVNELESLSRLNHKNLVRLLGFYEDLEERVLVYEYMENGTLSDHLHNPKYTPPPWQARVKIALEAARGIQYLHEYAVPPVIHRDIKSSNILLDATWMAKVSDFGLSLMGPTEDDVSHLSLHAAGTLGYIDPEYYRLQQLTTKSDVYSFGIVLLELLSGLKAIHKNEDENPRNVVDYVVPYILQDDVHRVLDRRVPPPTPYEIEAVAHVGSLAADCVMPVGRERPSMAEVVTSLERAWAACLMSPAAESLSRSTTQSSTG